VSKEWVVVRLRSGALRLVDAVILPVVGPGKVLVPVLPDAEAAAVEQVVNASMWRGVKRPARFRSGLPCIRCDGSRRTELLGVAIVKDQDRTLVGTIRPADAGSWEYRLTVAEGPSAADGARESGLAASAGAAFDAILAIAEARGWSVDARPSPILDTAA
jgi:hypothetical protein